MSRQTAHPFTEAEWMTFVDLYLDEAKKAYANFVGDRRSIQIRLLEAASLLVSALWVSCTSGQLESIAGRSRTDFPTFNGGIKQFKEIVEKEPNGASVVQMLSEWVQSYSFWEHLAGFGVISSSDHSFTILTKEVAMTSEERQRMTEVLEQIVAEKDPETYGRLLLELKDLLKLERQRIHLVDKTTP